MMDIWTEDETKDLLLILTSIHTQLQYSMECLHRISHRLLSLSTKLLHFHHPLKPIPIFLGPLHPARFSSSSPASPSRLTTRAGWLLGLGQQKNQTLPELVKAGDSVLHEAAREVDPDEIGLERVQKIIEDIINVMRMAPGVGFAPPLIGIPLFFLFLLLGMGQEKQQTLPQLVQAGDPVLHEPAREVDPNELGSERVQKIIEDMLNVMRLAPGVGLAAPQIGIPLKIIVLEDRKEFISYAPKEKIKAQDRRPFDLLVIVNPKLKKKGKRTALFFEGCLSVHGYRAVVERSLDVEVRGLDRYGNPIKVDASGWQARILQHECDHLDGTLYVDKMVPRTFRTVENFDLPLAVGCPKLGPH